MTNNPQKSLPRGNPRDRWSLIAAAAALMCMTLVACESKPYAEDEIGFEQEGAPLEDQPVQAQDDVTVEDVEGDPSRYYGQEVTVAGEVDDVLNKRAFLLEGGGFIWDDEIPILTRSDVTIDGADVTDDDALMVRGTVRPFVVAEIERELGWDVGSEIEIEMRGQPVIVAESISPVDQQASWTEGMADELPA